MRSGFQLSVCVLCFVWPFCIAVPLPVAAQNNSAVTKKVQPAAKDQKVISSSPADGSNPAYIDRAGVPYLNFRAMPNTKLKDFVAKLDPVKVSASTRHFWKGVIHKTDGDDEEAVAEFEQCKPVDRLSDWAISLFGDAYVMSGQPAKGYRLADQRLACGCKDADVYRVRADASNALGDFEKAAADYKLAAGVSKSKSNIYLAKSGECWRNLHNYDAAIKLFTQAIDDKSYSQESFIYTLRGRCFAALGQWAKAANDFTSTLDVSRRKADRKTEDAEAVVTATAYLERAACYDHLGKTGLAARDRAMHQKLSRAVESDFLGAPR